MKLKGKSVLVIGGGSGVMLTGRTLSKLETVRAEIRSAGGTADLDQGDVGSRSDVERMVSRTVDAFGGIDILVNNAQTWERNRPLADVTDDILAIPLRSGLYGSLHTMQACYPHFKARGGGSVINFGAAFTGSSITRAEQDPETWVRHMKTFPLGRLGDPEQDIGRAVAALADDDLGYLTGATLMLDGGKLLIA